MSHLKNFKRFCALILSAFVLVCSIPLLSEKTAEAATITCTISLPSKSYGTDYYAVGYQKDPSFSGKIDLGNSTSYITSVTVKITDWSGNVISGSGHTKTISISGKKSKINLSDYPALNQGINFANLSNNGKLYTLWLTYKAKDSLGRDLTTIGTGIRFAVVKAPTINASLTYSSIQVGKNTALKGNVNGATTLKKITIAVTKNGTTYLSFSKNLNSTTYNLGVQEVKNALNFSKLSTGYYTIKITVTDYNNLTTINSLGLSVER